MASNAIPKWNELILNNEINLEDFKRWFWTEKNGNELIDELNKGQRDRTQNFISRAPRPDIYCVVVNYLFDLKDSQEQWKFCKIGYTQVDTTPGTDNRMETVQSLVNKQYQCPSAAAVLFCLPIHPTDCRPVLEVEKGIRAAFGHKVPKEKAKELNFHVPTEWVITTQSFIDEIKKRIKAMSKEQGYASTKVFKACKFNEETNPVPDELKNLCFPDEEALKEFSLKMSQRTTPSSESKKSSRRSTGGTTPKAASEIEEDLGKLRLDDE